MSFLGDIFGFAGKKDAKVGKRNSRWLAPNVNLGGANASMTFGDLKKNIPHSYDTSLSPTQQGWYDQLGALANQGMTGLMTPPSNAVPGYAGVSPELYNEFSLSQQYPQLNYGSVGNIYQPNVNNMGQVRNVSYDGSGMPQVGFDPSGLPNVAYNGGGAIPQVSGGVSWNGKAEGLDKAYLDKSKQFLGASNPVTGFDGLAGDWYNALTQLSRDDQNNMLAAAGDKEFLRGMLGGENGQGYNPAMKAAFSAYNDADLQNKLAGYQVGADASQRNLQQALAAGGYVQQNDQTRLQQAIASGQLGLQAGIANQNAFLTGQGYDLQAQQANAQNWLNAQGLGLSAQQTNAANWLANQGMGLQAQGMNQSADSQNIANFLQGQGMLSDASAAQASRDLAANSQNLNINQFNADRANQRFLNAMNMFGMGQNTINAEQQRNMQQLATGMGGMSSYDQYLMSLLGLQGNLSSAQSGANLGAYSLPVQQAGQTNSFWSGLWGSMMPGGGDGG